MIDVRKSSITNGTNATMRFLSKVKPLASFFGIPEFYFTNAKEYLNYRKNIRDDIYVALKFLDINEEIKNGFLVGDHTGEFEARIPIDFATRGLLEMAGEKIPNFKKGLRLYDILLNKSNKKGDSVECFCFSPENNGIYYSSDVEYLTKRFALSFR